MKKAVVFGASGFIGSHLLTELLNSADYERVTIVVRKPLQLTHPKLVTLVGDLNTLPLLKSQIVADEVFITLGTTKKNTPNLEEYYKIDHDYPVLAAQIARENGAKSVFVVTAIGANPESHLFYVKTKGETERDILKLDYQHTHIFEPSMILGQRQEHRPFEKLMVNIWPVVDGLLMGRFDQYRGIDAKDVAQAMINAAKIQNDKIKIYRWREMNALL